MTVGSFFFPFLGQLLSSSSSSISFPKREGGKKLLPDALQAAPASTSSDSNGSLF